MNNPLPPLRIALIGVGGHARQILIPALEQIPDALRVVVMATAHAETARQAADRYRLPCRVGHEAALADPQVEAVVIASSDHERVALDALAAGKHVFTETPGITTRDGARRIRELARAKGLVYQVGYCLRYAPIYRQLKARFEAWRAQTPGPRTINVRYYPYIGHFQNLLLGLSGPITAVLAAEHADHGGAVTLYRFASGDLGCIVWSHFNHVNLPLEMVEITHPSGRLLAEEGRSLRFDRTPAERTTSPYALAFELADAELHQPTFSIPYGRNHQLYLRGYVPELEEFARCVRDRAAPLSGVDDAEASLLIREAAAASVTAGGNWVSVKPD